MNIIEYSTLFGQIRVSDDFVAGAVPQQWAAVNDGATGTNAIRTTDNDGGVLNIVTAAADNDYHYLVSGRVFRFAAGRPIFFNARVKLAEAATNAANIVLGLTSVQTAGIIADNGAGVVNNFDGALFYKVDGGAVWNFGSSNGTAQTLRTSVGAFVTDTWYNLGISFNPDGVTTSLIRAFLNGALVAENRYTVASSDTMAVLLGVKAGSANAETLQVDYVDCVQSTVGLRTALVG